MLCVGSVWQNERNGHRVVEMSRARHRLSVLLFSAAVEVLVLRLPPHPYCLIRTNENLARAAVGVGEE